MLEAMYAGFLAGSINLASLEATTIVPNVVERNILVDRELVAKGRDHESDYRREADRARERHLDYRDRDDRLQRIEECNEKYRGRIYREEQRIEECYGEYGGRIYRDAEQRRRELRYQEDDDLRERQPRDYRRDRSIRYYPRFRHDRD